jgi:hypothetical protein
MMEEDQDFMMLKLLENIYERQKCVQDTLDCILFKICGNEEETSKAIRDYMNSDMRNGIPR